VSVAVAAHGSTWRNGDMSSLKAAIDLVKYSAYYEFGAGALIACATWHEARRSSETAELLSKACAVYSTLKIQKEPVPERADLK